MRVIGVDPGIRGAVVVIDAAQRKMLDWCALAPHYIRACGLPVPSANRISGVMKMLATQYTPILAAIERPIVTPSASTKTASAWSTAASAAIIASASADAGVEPIFISAATWKNKFNLVGEAKEKAIDAASQCFGDYCTDLPRYLAIAVAEAALVALTAWEMCGVSRQADNN